MFSLLSVNADAKTTKGNVVGWLTAILYHAAHKTLAHAMPSEYGHANMCPYASPGCIATCLGKTAGRMPMANVQRAQLRRTLAYWQDRESFIQRLGDDIITFVSYASKRGMRPCIRLNGTSDRYDIIRHIAPMFPTVQFYDYTKIPMPWKRTMPNYHLTFSRSETNHADCINALAHGVNVAVIWRSKPFPATWNGYPVIDGDASDLRFLDASPCIVGLKAKGKARRDTTGFVLD